MCLNSVRCTGMKRVCIYAYFILKNHCILLLYCCIHIFGLRRRGFNMKLWYQREKPNMHKHITLTVIIILIMWCIHFYFIIIFSSPSRFVFSLSFGWFVFVANAWSCARAHVFVWVYVSVSTEHENRPRATYSETERILYYWQWIKWNLLLDTLYTTVQYGIYKFSLWLLCELCDDGGKSERNGVVQVE